MTAQAKATLERLDAFVSEVCPSARSIAPHLWADGSATQVSYPDDGHASYAEIEKSSFWFAHRNAAIAEIVGRFPPSGPIFDVGGGNGFVSLGLGASGFPAVVVEPGEVGARRATERGLIAIQAQLHEGLFRPGSLDAVGFFDVIEHVEDDVALLSTAARALAPRGRVYVTVPAYGALWSEEDVIAGHYRRYTRASLQRSLSAAGFDVEYMTALFAVLVAPVFALRSLPSLFGRIGRRGRQVAAEHRLPPGPIGRAVARSLAWELSRLRRGSTIPFGTSLLAVGRRRGDAAT